MKPDLSPPDTVADVYLRQLAHRGIDCLFANAGTDFAPIIEAYAKAQVTGSDTPRPVTVPHENVAIAMAIGHYLGSGRPQAVMVHVTVGTANALCGLMNASRGNIPVLMTAGRTPFTESGRVRGARSGENHWSQDMRDQGSLVREYVKWDYQLPHADILEASVDRAMTIAMSEPRGPVYLSLPREVLGSPAEPLVQAPGSYCPTAFAPDPDAIQTAARIIAEAKNPLIITTNGGRTAEEFEALGRFTDTFAIPLTQRKPRFMAISTDHPMHRGYAPDDFIGEADAILVIECDVPWVPGKVQPGADCKVVHIGVDPIFATYPLRGFRSDAALTGGVPATLALLETALESYATSHAQVISERRERIVAEREKQRAQWRAMPDAARTQQPMSPTWISYCINQIKGEDGIIVRELPLVLNQMDFTRPDCYFSPNWAAGLGSGLGVALGVKMTKPDQLVICVVGDGSYMFGTPLAAHYVSRAEDLPFLTIIFNNERWDAVRGSTRAMYPNGYAARSNAEPMTYFETGTRFESVVAAAGGYGERVEDPAELPAALKRAVHAVTQERRQAVLNIVCA